MFVNFWQSYGSWLKSEFCFYSIFCEWIDKFWSNLVYILILTRCRFRLSIIYRVKARESCWLYHWFWKTYILNITLHAETRVTPKISTVEGYHAVLRTLLLMHGESIYLRPNIVQVSCREFRPAIPSYRVCWKVCSVNIAFDHLQ